MAKTTSETEESRLKKKLSEKAANGGDAGGQSLRRLHKRLKRAQRKRRKLAFRKRQAQGTAAGQAQGAATS